MSVEVKESEPPNSDDIQNETIKEEVKLQFHLYIAIFLAIYYGSWILPAIIFWGYFFFPFRIFFLENSGFLSIFTEFNSLISLLLMPIVIFGCYLLHLFLTGVFTRIFWRISEKISPSKSGVIPRNIRSKAANYYHIRSFMIKYGKNTFMKGAFPFLSNWFFNFVGSNKIGKGSTLEESVGNDKFLNIGNNCYIGVNSTLASHLIQGIFGNISYFEIKVGDNVTAAAMSQIGPGSEIYDNSFLLPLASTSKHSVLKGNNYYFGIPLRKIFKRKIMSFLSISQEDIERNENLTDYTSIEKQDINNKNTGVDKKQHAKKNNPISTKSFNTLQTESINGNDLSEKDLAIDFTTSSAISKISIKFLIVYIPIFWISGLLTTIFWYWYYFDSGWLAFLIFLPFAMFGMFFIFVLSCMLFSKLLLTLVNLIHKPKEGIFKAEVGDTDFEFWRLRTELKKIGLWLFRNSTLPWTDAFAFKNLGVDMDYSSHLNDTWCDAEFIKFGRKVLVGQGATIMSSMVVGKYLIIKNLIFDDYAMVGGHTTIAPGTLIGKESVIGALSSTTFNQILEPGWVYFGFPAIKLKENKYAEERRDLIIKRDVDEAKKFEMTHEVNIDEDKKELIKIEKEMKDT